MSVDRRISIATIRSELDKCHEHCKRFGWKISEIDEEALSFTALMESPIDQEKYLMEVQFDNYPQLPALIEFIEPDTGARGTTKAYPKSEGSFFHGMPCICNPCSRKSYKQFSENAPHGDWQLDGWRDNPQTGNLKSINSILSTIYRRISDKRHYTGRMS